MGDSESEKPARTRRGGWIWLIAFFLVVVSSCAVVGGYLFLQHTLNAAGPVTKDGDARIIVVPAGASVRAISEALEMSGAVEHGTTVRIGARVMNAEQRLRAGEYAIPSGASTRQIIDILSSGRTLLHPVTIAEGLTIQAVLTRLEAEEVLVGDLPGTPPPEGSLLPDTYMVHRGEERSRLIERMQRSQEELLQGLWDTRQPNLPLSSMAEALTLASIVEKETGLPEERPQVAAVFINRLRKGMRLETDPTIIYGVCKLHPDRCRDGRLVDGDGNQRGIRQSELAMETGYNTYRIDGLPPSPICNPGREAIMAVLDPPVSDALFFVADGSGGHVFSSTYAEHQRNVRKWRSIERSRGR